MIFQSAEVPEMGAMSLETMGAGFCIRVPDSQKEADRVYKAYLAFFAEMFGSGRAYEIVDSISDGAKERNPVTADLEDDRSGEDDTSHPDTEEGRYDAQPEGSAEPENNEQNENGAVEEDSVGNTKPEPGEQGSEGTADEEEPDGNAKPEDNGQEADGNTKPEDSGQEADSAADKERSDGNEQE